MAKGGNMTTDDKIKYAIDHPSMGRDRLAKVLGIGLSEARELVGFRKRALQSKASKVINQDILKFMKSGVYSLTDIANRFDMSPAKVQIEVDTLIEQGYLVNAIDDKLTAGDYIEKQEPISIDYKKYGETEICIGAFADTHLCSKYARLDVLNALYDRFADYPISDVYLAGNWIDGEARFNKGDLLVHGLQNQVNYFIDNLPQKDGITTNVLSGDDHEGWYVQRENINIGRFLENEAKNQGRGDIIDIGYMERDIELKRKNGGSMMRIAHMGGGSSYALSYFTQQYNNSLQGGEKPSIILTGHPHKFDYNYYREIHTVQVGCVCDQTPFMRKRKLQAHLGGCVVWIKQADNGIITSFKVEWIPFYDKKFYEYHW
jgi:hypothetical protein